MKESTPETSVDPEKVAERLVAVRAALGLDKASFSDIIGIDRSSYTKIEKGIKPLLPPYAFKIYQLYSIDMNFIYLGQLGGLPQSLSKDIITHLTRRKS